MASSIKKSLNQKYLTPLELYQPVLGFIGKPMFHIDVCCSEPNIPAMIRFFESCIDGLKVDWYADSVCFMNPPFEFTPKWLKKAFSEVSKNNCEVWCVLPGNRMNANYFQKFLNTNDNWFGVFLAGKVNFYNPEADAKTNIINKGNGGLNSPIMVLYIGKNSKKYCKKWKKNKPIAGLVFGG